MRAQPFGSLYSNTIHCGRFSCYSIGRFASSGRPRPPRLAGGVVSVVGTRRKATGSLVVRERRAAAKLRMNLSLDGRGEEGIDIDRNTSLGKVRDLFPVPDEYVFGVPKKLEDTLLATDFLPLVLLKTAETHAGTIRSRPINEHPLLVAANKELRELKQQLAELEAKRQREARQAAGAVAQAQRERAELAQELYASQTAVDALKDELRSRTAKLAAWPAQLKQALGSLAAEVRTLQREHAEQVNEMAKQLSAFAAADVGSPGGEQISSTELERQLRELQQAREHEAHELRRLRMLSKEQSEALEWRDAQIGKLEAQLRDALEQASAPRGFSEYVELKRDVNDLCTGQSRSHLSSSGLRRGPRAPHLSCLSPQPLLHMAQSSHDRDPRSQGWRHRGAGVARAREGTWCQDLRRAGGLRRQLGRLRHGRALRRRRPALHEARHEHGQRAGRREGGGLRQHVTPVTSVATVTLRP